MSERETRRRGEKGGVETERDREKERAGLREV